MAKTILIQFKGEDNVSKTAQTVENSIKKVGTQTTQMANSVSSASQKTNKHLTDLGSQFRYMSLVSGLAAAGALSLAKSFITASKEMQDAQLKLGVYALSAGEDLDAVNAAAQRLYSTGLIPLTDASTAMANLLATGLGLEKSTQLLDTFLDAIVVGKENINDTFGDALVKASLGVRIFQERQIDASGINTQLNQVYKEYGKTIGKVTTAMTNADKYQAIFNFYMREGTRFTGSADLASQTLSGTLSKLSASATILRATIGNALLPALGALTEILGKASSFITTLARQFPALTSIIVVGTITVTVLTAAIAGLGALLPLLVSGFAAVGIVIAPTLVGLLSMVGTILAVAAAIGALVYVVLKATGQWDKWINSMKNLTVKMKDLIKPMKAVGDVTDENNKKLQKQLRDIERNIAITTRDFKEGMAEWAKKHDETITDLKKQIQSLDAEYKKATDSIKKRFSDTMTSMQIDHSRKVEDIQREIAEEVSKGVWADQTRIRSLQRELARENEDYASATVEKAQLRDDDLAEEKETHDTKLEELQKKLDEELALEKKHAGEIALARLTPILDEIEKRKRAFEERIQQLNEEKAEVVSNMTVEVAAIGAVGAATTASISKTQQLQAELKKVTAQTTALGTAAGQAGLIVKLTVDDLITRYLKLGQTIYDAGLKADGLIGRIIDKLGGAINSAALGTYNFFQSTVPNFIKGMSLPAYADGGVVPGSPSQPVPIMAHGGETILPHGVAPMTININNPIVRSDADLTRIAEMVKQVLTNSQRFRQVT